jgi:glutamine cyclotransferase
VSAADSRADFTKGRAEHLHLLRAPDDRGTGNRFGSGGERPISLRRSLQVITFSRSGIDIGLAMFGWFCCVALLAAAPSAQRRITPAAPVSRYQVVHVYPHDPQAFTQGLVYADGALYEGTGLYGKSTIRKVKLENGAVLQIQKIDPQYFGEGITVWRDKILELTWRSGVGFIYDRKSFDRTGVFTYTGEGWGLTHDGTRLIMSDGSSHLRFLDPATQKETGRIQVRDGPLPIEHLNELEFVKGEVLANVWQTDRIARISLKTGQVTGWIDLHGLLSGRDAAEGADVLNGIAYDQAGDRLFVTGKLWPKLFEITIVP